MPEEWVYYHIEYREVERYPLGHCMLALKKGLEVFTGPCNHGQAVSVPLEEGYGPGRHSLWRKDIQTYRYHRIYAYLKRSRKVPPTSYPSDIVAAWLQGRWSQFLFPRGNRGVYHGTELLPLGGNSVSLSPSSIGNPLSLCLRSCPSPLGSVCRSIR